MGTLKFSKKVTSTIAGIISGLATKGVVSLLTDNDTVSTMAGVSAGTATGIVMFEKMDEIETKVKSILASSEVFKPAEMVDDTTTIATDEETTAQDEPEVTAE